jgi:peroxiredoxin
MGFNFPLLSDAAAGVIRRYDVLHRGAGPKNNDVARPAEFYVDANGMVQWVDLNETIAVRAPGTSIERHRCDEGWPAIDAASLT